MVKLLAEGVTKQYWLEREQRDFLALDRVNLSINEREFVCIVGPSGCGKTTFLNMVAGLLSCEEGALTIDGHRVEGPGTERALVFQSDSLLPWRTVFDNVLFGMQLHKKFNVDEMQSRAQDFIKMVGLQGTENQYPSELSGATPSRPGLQSSSSRRSTRNARASSSPGRVRGSWRRSISRRSNRTS